LDTKEPSSTNVGIFSGNVFGGVGSGRERSILMGGLVDVLVRISRLSEPQISSGVGRGSSRPLRVGTGREIVVEISPSVSGDDESLARIGSGVEGGGVERAVESTVGGGTGLNIEAESSVEKGEGSKVVGHGKDKQSRAGNEAFQFVHEHSITNISSSGSRAGRFSSSKVGGSIAGTIEVQSIGRGVDNSLQSGSVGGNSQESKESGVVGDVEDGEGKSSNSGASGIADVSGSSTRIDSNVTGGARSDFNVHLIQTSVVVLIISGNSNVEGRVHSPFHTAQSLRTINHGDVVGSPSDSS